MRRLAVPIFSHGSLVVELYMPAGHDPQKPHTPRSVSPPGMRILEALRQGTLAGAGLDVVEGEPLKTAEEAATPNLIVTCHAAFCSVESKREMRASSARIARAAVLVDPWKTWSIPSIPWLINWPVYE